MSESALQLLWVVLPAAAVVSLPSFLLVLVLWRGIRDGIGAIEKGFSNAARLGALDAKVAEMSKRIHDYGRDLTLALNKLRGELQRVEDAMLDHRAECSHGEDDTRRTG